MISIRLFRDHSGYPWAVFQDPKGHLWAHGPQRWHFLAQFLMCDIQGNLAWTWDLRDIVKDYRLGTASEVWAGTGNAWTLALTPESNDALLQLSIFPDDNIWGTVPLEILDHLLAGWGRMLETNETQVVEFDAYDPRPHRSP